MIIERVINKRYRREIENSHQKFSHLHEKILKILIFWQLKTGLRKSVS